MGMVTPPQRPPRHRTSRCLVLLRHRAIAAALRLGPARIPPPDSFLLCCTPDSAGIAQRAGARPERLLSVLGAHGPASGADPNVSAAAPGWNSRLAAASPGEPRGDRCRRPGG